MTADTDIEFNFGKPIPKAEPGTYPAILVGIDPFVINEKTPEAKTLVRWDFSLDGTEDPEQPGMTIILDGTTSTATGPRSKMRPWVTVLLGRQLGEDERLSLADLRANTIGHPCLVQVEINESGYSKVANVLPPLRQPARPAAAATVNDSAAYAAAIVREAVAQPMTALPNMAEPEGPTSLPRDPNDLPF